MNMGKAILAVFCVCILVYASTACQVKTSGRYEAVVGTQHAQ